MAPDLWFDAGLVDTFLHGRDRSYTVDDCLDLVASAGLIFQEWFLKSPYYPPEPYGGRLYAAVAELPQERQWTVMERINTRNACHFFTACRGDRPHKTYRIDFASPEVLNAVPVFRYRCGLDASAVFRPDWRMSLDPNQIALVQKVDGRRSIREIVAVTARTDPLSQLSLVDLEDFSRTLFQSLWQRDFLAMGIRT